MAVEKKETWNAIKKCQINWISNVTRSNDKVIKSLSKNNFAECDWVESAVNPVAKNTQAQR